MAKPSSVPRLTDIIEAIELIRSEMAGVTLNAFEPDRRKRWLVERGLEIISEASRHLPAALKARHASVPWPKVAGIGNVLRHDYEQVAHDVLWHVVRDDLPLLENVCREELAAEITREQQKR
ncbi:MAG: HepT-like ribonuclease domain-containing protein [Candidatus Binataceae bacterium]